MKTIIAAASLIVCINLSVSGQYKDLEFGERFRSIGFYIAGGANLPFFLSKSVKTANYVTPSFTMGFTYGNRFTSHMRFNLASKSRFDHVAKDMPSGANYYSSEISYIELEGAFKGSVIGSLNTPFSLLMGLHGSVSLRGRETNVQSSFPNYDPDPVVSEGLTRIGFSFTGMYHLKNRLYAYAESGLHVGILYSNNLDGDNQPLPGLLNFNTGIVYILAFGKGD